jgi:hypothetical protein
MRTFSNICQLFLEHTLNNPSIYNTLHGLTLYLLNLGTRPPTKLLASGWWGLSRHFHYIPEILLALFWTLPAGFENVMPFSYEISPAIESIISRSINNHSSIFILAIITLK